MDGIVCGMDTVAIKRKLLGCLIRYPYCDGDGAVNIYGTVVECDDVSDAYGCGLNGAAYKNNAYRPIFVLQLRTDPVLFFVCGKVEGLYFSDELPDFLYNFLKED